jgi:hypothetical protein
MKHTVVGALVLAALALALGMTSNAGATVPHYTGCLTDKGAFIGFAASLNCSTSDDPSSIRAYVLRIDALKIG